MQYYELSQFPHGDAETIVWKEKGYNQGDTRHCPACAGSIGMLAWLPPYRVTLEPRRNEYGDFVFSSGDDFLVSERFRDLYEQHGFTGLLGFDPVEVIKVKSRRKRLPEPPSYFRVNPMWGGPALDLATCEVEWIEPPKCSFCRAGTIMRWKRLTIEEGTWHGEDAFRPRGLSGAIMVSERFRALCHEHDIKNAEFILADFAGHDFYPGLTDIRELDSPRKNEC